MDLSGVIFVVLALAWAGFLIPKLLHHHDQVARTRAVDRFSSAIRVLARREPVDGRRARLVVTRRTTTRRTTDVEVTRAPASAPTAAMVPPARPGAARAHGRAALKAARRRRRVLGGLAVALVAVGVAVAAAALPPWSVAVPAGLTLVYLVLCRALVRREHRRWERARPSARREAAEPGDVVATVEVTETVEAEVTGSDPEAPHAESRNPQGFAEVSANEDTVALRTEELQAAAALWDPLPITLPTYVGKPKARRTVRTIDLSAGDVSSSGRDSADSRLVAETAEPESPEEPRRAVGS